MIRFCLNSFSKGKALIIKIQKNSVVSEDERLQIGDILDEINGQVVSSHTSGNLKKVMSKAVGQPVSLHIVKVYLYIYLH